MSGPWVLSPISYLPVITVIHTHPDYTSNPLPGYTPFDRDTQRQEMEAIIAGDYRFEPGKSPRTTCSALFIYPLGRGVLVQRLRDRS
jgi:hypothetical protein